MAKQFGIDYTCENCMFVARSMPPGQIIPILVCAWGPPPVVAVQRPDGTIGIDSVYRPIPPNKFCFQYRPIPNAVNADGILQEKPATDG
jgi:hypothetical protein